MNSLVLLAAMLIPGPDFEIPRKNLFILVDTKASDWYIMRRSKKVYEILIKDARFFPSQLYYLNSRYNVEIQEVEDHQYDKYKSIPSFRLSKNAEWEEFCPDTFAADGTFTLSLYSIVKWIDFEEELGYFATLNWTRIQYGYPLPLIPNYYPMPRSNDQQEYPGFIKFYHKEKLLRNLPQEYSSKHNNIFQEQFIKLPKGLLNDVE